MGDFLERKDFNMDKKIEKLLITHANINKEKECCGFIVLDNINEQIIVPCQNIYESPETGFKICPHEFLKIKKKYEIICLYHSHPVGEAKFSKKDLDQAEELCLPICVYSLETNSFNIHFPESYEIRDFIGRKYIHHFQNCWTLIYDYYNSKNKLIHKDFNFYLQQIEDHKFSEQTVLSITNFCKKNNFKKIHLNEAKPGDLMIFKADNKNFSHFGILLENNEFMHHQQAFLSSKSLLDDNYIKKIHSMYRIVDN